MTEQQRMSADEFKVYITKQRAYKRRPQKPYVAGENPLAILMHPRRPPKHAKRGQEDRLSALLADCLRPLSEEGLLIATWTAIMHEGKAHELTEMVNQEKGKIPGATDFVFVSATGGGWIELKVKPNGLAPNQERFRDWCNMRHARWACFVSRSDTYNDRRDTVSAILTTLNEWDLLPDLRAAFDLCRTTLANPISEDAQPWFQS